MTIKIQCPCGSKYSFEVDPVEGRMPFAVHCPTCNADGTEMANQLIAEAPGNRSCASTPPRPWPANPGEPPPRPRPPSVATALQKIATGAASIPRRRLDRGRWRWSSSRCWARGVGLLSLAPNRAWNILVKVPGSSAGWHTEFLDPGVILLVSPDHATAHDLNAGKDLWSVSLSDKDSAESAPPQTYVDKDSIWICLGTRVIRLNRATGEMKQTIPITGQFQSFTPSDTSLLVVSAKDETTRLASRIDLASGEVSTDEITVPRAQKHAMPNELPPNVQPTAGVLLAQALDEQKFNKPLDAMSSEFFSTGANLVELRVKLLEPKVTFVQSIKPRGPTHITSSLSASSSTADVAEEVFNDIKRDQTGGVKGIDESRYEATSAAGWAAPGGVEGRGHRRADVLFPQNGGLAGGRPALTVFDKENKKLFDAKLAYPVNNRYNPDRWDHHSVPAVEGNGGLYFFDEGVLTAFSLPSGEVRWRLTSVGISKVQFDDHGVLYVDSTSGNPEDIQYSDQIKFDQAAPVLLKIDPSSGKILWQVAKRGRELSFRPVSLHRQRATRRHRHGQRPGRGPQRAPPRRAGLFSYLQARPGRRKNSVGLLPRRSSRRIFLPAKSFPGPLRLRRAGLEVPYFLKRMACSDTFKVLLSRCEHNHGKTIAPGNQGGPEPN
jgi:hypothetical protein